MIGLAGIMSTLGLFSILSRKTLLGLLVGVELLILGATLAFVFAGINSPSQLNATVFAFFIAVSGLAQVVTGCALLLRMFYLKSSDELKDLGVLKQ